MTKLRLVDNKGSSQSKKRDSRPQAVESFQSTSIISVKQRHTHRE